MQKIIVKLYVFIPPPTEGFKTFSAVTTSLTVKNVTNGYSCPIRRQENLEIPGQAGQKKKKKVWDILISMEKNWEC
jgi:hypothetical protein